MRDPTRASAALRRADAAADEIGRTLWLAKAADHGVSGLAVLVGGAAVNLHTGSYVPTDVDMCAYLDEADRLSLASLGFRHVQGDHFEFTFADGERWLVEFPDTEVDGTTTTLLLDDGELLQVISLESLLVDRFLQATDGSRVTFEEALRLMVAVLDRADWATVEADLLRREASGTSGLLDAYERVRGRARTLREH